MGKAKKLPSGAWRVRVYDYTDNMGKLHYRSFTSDTRKSAEFAAASFSVLKNNEKHNNLSFSMALNKYIESRSKVLSPTTIREYKRTAKADFVGFGSKQVDMITANDIQKFINIYASNHAPKTVKNLHGIITAVMRTYRPQFAFNTTLPKRVAMDRQIPSDGDIRTLVTYTKDTTMEVAILLAAFGSMRRGEVCALKYEDIKGSTIHVNKSMAYTGTGWIEKTPKTLSSDRYIELPKSVIKRIGTGSGYVVPMTPTAVTDAFIDICKNAGVKHYRFHDLRHYCASTMHAMGVPDAYIMQRGGWRTDTVLKSVYRHALPEESKQVSEQVNKYFEALI